MYGQMRTKNVTQGQAVRMVMQVNAQRKDAAECATGLRSCSVALGVKNAYAKQFLVINVRMQVVIVRMRSIKNAAQRANLAYAKGFHAPTKIAMKMSARNAGTRGRVHMTSANFWGFFTPSPPCLHFCKGNL